MLKAIAGELRITMEELIYGQKISGEPAVRDRRPLIKKAVILAAATAAMVFFVSWYDLWAQELMETQYIIEWSFCLFFVVISPILLTSKIGEIFFYCFVCVGRFDIFSIICLICASVSSSSAAISEMFLPFASFRWISISRSLSSP